MTWGNRRRRQHRMIALNLTAGALAPEAMPAAELLRAKILGSIERDQHVIAQPAEAVQAARDRFQRSDRIGEYRIKPFRLCRIQHVANMIVAGNLGDPEQALAVRAAMAMLQPPLMREKRRALHEKHRKCRHPDVAHPIARIDPATFVRERVQASSQCVEQANQGLHSGIESDSCRFANPLSTRALKRPHPPAAARHSSNRHVTAANAIHSH